MNQNQHPVVAALLHFQDVGDGSSGWSRGVCRALANCNFDDNNYYTGQSMEPSLLDEVARETSIPLQDLLTLSYASTGPMASVQWLYQQRAFAPRVQRLSLAFCLITAVRYELAREVLATIEVERLPAEQQNAYFMAKFMIDNRLGGTSHEREFAAMKALDDAGRLSLQTVLGNCSQAIVWYLKTDSIGEALSKSFIERGLSIAEKLNNTTKFSEQIALSSFYRAYAMVPAARKDVQETRAMMEKAEAFAFAAKPSKPVEELAAFDAKKTVFESSLKEYLYVAKDFAKAEQAGLELIKMDPNWSISYHELAEVYLHQGKTEKALELYKKALSVGLPRMAKSQYMIGACLGELGRSEEALVEFEKTLRLDPTNISAGISGNNIAKRIGHSSKDVFANYLSNWETSGMLAPEHKELVE